MTTHCFRKTGYLFAVWGGGVFNVIAHSARHDDEGVAMVYFKDAEAIKLLADDRPIKFPNGNKYGLFKVKMLNLFVVTKKQMLPCWKLRHDSGAT